MHEKHTISGDLLHERVGVGVLSLLHCHSHVAPSHCASRTRIESSERQHRDSLLFVHFTLRKLGK